MDVWYKVSNPYAEETKVRGSSSGSTTDILRHIQHTIDRRWTTLNRPRSDRGVKLPRNDPLAAVFMLADDMLARVQDGDAAGSR